LKGNPPSWNQGNWGKPHGKGFLCFIPEGEVEEDGICTIIIVPGEENLFCFGKGNLQVDLFTFFPFWNRKANVFFLNPKAAFPSRPFYGKSSIVDSMARFGYHRDRL